MRESETVDCDYPLPSTMEAQMARTKEETASAEVASEETGAVEGATGDAAPAAEAAKADGRHIWIEHPTYTGY